MINETSFGTHFTHKTCLENHHNSHTRPDWRNISQTGGKNPVGSTAPPTKTKEAPGPCECFPAITRFSHEGLQLILSRCRKLRGDSCLPHHPQQASAEVRRGQHRVHSSLSLFNVTCSFIYIFCVPAPFFLTILPNLIPFLLWWIGTYSIFVCFSNCETASLF